MIFSDYTIKELADRAKVSTATVSRILSGKGSHRPGTVERVRRIAEKMEAESRAREFGISECIGVLMLTYRDCLNSSYNSTLITSIVEGLAAENCTVQLMALPVKRMNLDHIRSLVIEHGIRALIVPEFNGPYSVSNELDRLGIPIVTIGNIELDGDKSEIVCTDNDTAGSDAANYLWSCGHRRFGVICMDRRNLCHRQRVESFRQTVARLGGDPDEIYLREYDHIAESLAPVVTELRNLGDRRPTALLSTNSLLTLKLLNGLHDAGLRVPDDLSLLSFEEDRELAETIPPVTVLAQPTRSMGELAVRRVMKAIRGFESQNEEILRCSLVVRRSVKSI